MSKTEILHYPNLKTVLMVEDVLKKANRPMQREQLKKKLDKQIMHQTLNVILRYLEDGGKILDGRKGILWIYNPSPKLDKAIKEGIELAKEALLSSTQRDVYSGYGIDIFTITKEGIKKAVEKEISSELK